MKITLKKAIFDALRTKASAEQASAKLREAIKDSLDPETKMLTTQQVEEIVAYLIERHPCVVKRNKFGRVSTFENLPNATEPHAKAAENFYKRYIAQYDPAKKDKRGGNTRNKAEVDLVAEALKLIKQMTPAQRKQVVAKLS